MHFIPSTRIPQVLCELFAVAAALLWVGLGAGCFQRSPIQVRQTAGAQTRQRDVSAHRPTAVRTKTREAKRTKAAKLAKLATRTLPIARVVASYQAHFQKLKGLSGERQRALHRRTYLRKLGLDVRRAEFHAGFTKAFRLSGRARRVLHKHGFVVVPGPRRRTGKSSRNVGEGPSNIFYRVFSANLPVFVSADSILHAWHRSFEQLLLTLEENELLARLRRMLSRTLAALDPSSRAGRDAYVYVAVARSLLNPRWMDAHKRWRPGHSTRRQVGAIDKAVRGNRVTPIRLFGRYRRLDGRWFSPQGRFARTDSLWPYFRAITWLSRVELRLSSRRAGARPDREEAAARALVAAMKAGKALADYQALERVYGLLFGRPMAVTPKGLLGLCAKAGLAGCRGQGRDMMRHYAALPSPAYSPQFYAGNRPAVRLSLLPRRFAYDVWVTTRTTTPGLPPLRSFGRSMAQDLDIAFALGSDRALDRLGGEMGLSYRKHLPAALEAARRTLHDVKPTRVADAVYSHWLEALMALSKTDLSSKLPRVLRTAAWQDRKLEATLGSLVELRQDAGPLVAPSMGGDGCQYPKGYVEPVPELFRALSRAAARVALVLPKGKKYASPNKFLKHWHKTLKRLERLATLQRAAKPMTAKDLRFLSHTVDRHAPTYSGVRSYDGWYPKLFWSRHWMPGRSRPGQAESLGGSLSKLSLATLHVDTDRRRVLQAGTGHPGLMVVAIDVNGKTALYGGPVYSYHRFNRPLSKPMSDQEWETRVTHSAPRRPPFARAYHVR